MYCLTRWAAFGSLLFLAVGCATQTTQIDELAEKQRRIRSLEREVARLGRDKMEIQQQVKVHQDQVLVKNKEVDALRVEVEKGSKARREAEETTRMALARVSETQRQKESIRAEMKKLSIANKSVVGPKAKPSVVQQNGKYHLRIISLPKDRNGEVAVREIEKALSKAGYKGIEARTSGKFWVIDIGRFTSMKSAEAQALKTRIRGFKYQGVRQFKTAYFVTY
ncbi:MAG: hypothetical protein QF752_09230 [Planctomycetota bacterium]|jgi:TolA-binding protein|nr:hypothetical protein [Planctomycetota bacterium]